MMESSVMIHYMVWGQTSNAVARGRVGHNLKCSRDVLVKPKLVLNIQKACFPKEAGKSQAMQYGCLYPNIMRH